MTMDEKLRDWIFKEKEEKIKTEKGSAMQSFRDLIDKIRRHLEAVHSTKRTALKTGKKVLCIAQIKTEFNWNFVV